MAACAVVRRGVRRGVRVGAHLSDRCKTSARSVPFPNSNSEESEAAPDRSAHKTAFVRAAVADMRRRTSRPTRHISPSAGRALLPPPSHPSDPGEKGSAGTIHAPTHRSDRECRGCACARKGKSPLPPPVRTAGPCGSTRSPAPVRENRRQSRSTPRMEPSLTLNRLDSHLVCSSP